MDNGLLFFSESTFMAEVIKWELQSFRIKAEHQKHNYPRLENQLENLINEVTSLTSMENSFKKLTRFGEPNKLYLQLAIDAITVSSSSADMDKWICIKWELRTFRISMATVIKMMPRQKPSSNNPTIYRN